MTCHFLKSLGKDSVCDINQDLKASSRTRPSGSEKQPIQRMSFCGVCFCKRSGQSVSAFHKSEAGPADFSCPSFNFQSHSIYFIQPLSNLLLGRSLLVQASCLLSRSQADTRTYTLQHNDVICDITSGIFTPHTNYFQVSGGKLTAAAIF